MKRRFYQVVSENTPTFVGGTNASVTAGGTISNNIAENVSIV